MKFMQRLLTFSMFAVFFVSGLGNLAPWSETRSAQSGDPVIVGAGDIADCSRTQDESTAKLLDNISGTVFTTGDNAYPEGTLAQFNDCYAPTWGRHKNRTKPSPGNHDYHTSGAAGYFDYFGAAAGQQGKGYYSYNLGSWHIIVLNSEIASSAGSAQETWLRADLAANPKTCTLAYWHKPRFSSGQHGNISSVGPFWKALYDYGADVVLNGHDHTYERFAPQNPSGQADAKGIREFIVGTGGRGLYAFTSTQPNSQVRNNTTWGVLKLTLHANSYDWQFIPIAGQNFTDSGRADCVGGGGSAPTPTSGPGITTTMHMGDLDGTSSSQGNRWTATVTITVHDANHNPLANVNVTGKWSNGATGTGSCTTGSNGQCSISKADIGGGKNRVTFTINNLNRNGYTYTSASNHDPDGSSNGTRIVVRKP